LRSRLGMPKRFVYVLRSLKQPERRYVGLTSDVGRRLAAHNAGLSPFTARYRPWSMTVCIEFADEGSASRFERYLKSPSGVEPGPGFAESGSVSSSASALRFVLARQ